MHEAIEEQVRLGRKIQAIKIYREQVRSTLLDAKNEVEYFMAHGRWSSAATAAFASREASSQAAAPVTVSAPRYDLSEAEAHARAGRKIQAIKEFRRITGVGLKDAKTAVEAFLRGAWPAPYQSSVGAPASTSAAAPAPSSTTTAAGYDLREAEALARAGRKIHAIKEVRRVTGIGLRDAKAAVEAFMRGAWPATLGGASAGAAAPAKERAKVTLTATPKEPKVKAKAKAKAKATLTAKPTEAKATKPKAAPRSTTPAAVKRVDASPSDAAAIAERLGVRTLQQLYEVEKDFARGYLAIVGDAAHFVIKRFGDWDIDETYARSDGIDAELRTSLSRVELRLRKTFIADAITGLDEATARAIALLLDPEAKV
jgi:ribosomal protein L7/L12